MQFPVAYYIVLLLFARDDDGLFAKIGVRDTIATTVFRK